MEAIAAREKTANDPLAPAGTDNIEVTFYTDPLCCWSWAMEPHWQRLRSDHPNDLRVTYKTIGLLPAWDRFHDAVHSLRKPIHMGPEWAHARQISGMPIADRIWIDDPPASSFPACIAVKCAEDQSPAFGAAYLRILREAVMCLGRNIARTSVLIDLAAGLAQKEKDFHLFEFRDALLGPRGKELFRRDYQEALYLGIRRTPTLVFKFPHKSSVCLQGYSTYEELQCAIKKLLSQ